VEGRAVGHSCAASRAKPACTLARSIALPPGAETCLTERHRPLDEKTIDIEAFDVYR
jgi:hypothetical protein